MPSILGTPNEALSPELGALVTLVRPECTAERAVSLIRDTPGLFDAARRHQMVPLVYDRWAGELEAVLRAGEFEHWRQGFLWLLSLCHSRRAEMARVLVALEAAGIPVVVVRGLWLAESVYADPVQRTHVDVDIIVPLEAASGVAPVLEARGYSLRDESSLMQAQREARELPAGQYDSWGSWTRAFAAGLFVDVDVHVGLPLVHAHWWPYRAAAAAVMAHAEPWELLGATARCLNPHYALLAQCENIARHSVGGTPVEDQLIRYHDLRLLLPRLTSADWDEFVADARALRMGLPAWLILERAAALWDMALPAGLRERLGVGGAALALARIALRRPRFLGHAGQKALFQLAGADSLALAAAYVCRNLLPGLRALAARTPSRQIAGSP
jgi:hypothetical protein